MNDQQLVTEFLEQKSEHAFLRLYRAKTPHLYQMALRLTQDEYKSEELIQETWIIALRRFTDFQWRSELKTWLIGILINLHRSMRKADEKELSVSAEQLSKASDQMVNPIESTADLEAAIAMLPSGYRQIILLHDVEGYKHREIAEMLDITEGTSKSQLFYARRAIREYLNDDNAKPEGHE